MDTDTDPPLTVNEPEAGEGLNVLLDEATEYEYDPFGSCMDIVPDVDV